MKVDKAKKRILKRIERGFKGYPQITLEYFDKTTDFATEVALSRFQKQNAMYPNQGRVWQCDEEKEKIMVIIEIISGNFEKTHWRYENGKFNKGWYNVYEIPMGDIISIEKGEVIKKQNYVNFRTNTNQSFVAKMNEKTYSIIYYEFMKIGKRPTSDTLPIHRKSKSFAVFGIVVMLIIVVGLINSEGNSTKSSTSQSNPESDARFYCSRALEDVAIYGAKIPWTSNTQVFSFDDGRRFSVAMDAEIKNAFGVWGKSRISCDVNGTKVTQLVIDGKKIY